MRLFFINPTHMGLAPSLMHRAHLCRLWGAYFGIAWPSHSRYLLDVDFLRILARAHSFLHIGASHSVDVAEAVLDLGVL